MSRDVIYKVHKLDRIRIFVTGTWLVKNVSQTVNLKHGGSTTEKYSLKNGKTWFNDKSN